MPNKLSPRPRLPFGLSQHRRKEARAYGRWSHTFLSTKAPRCLLLGAVHCPWNSWIFTQLILSVISKVQFSVLQKKGERGPKLLGCMALDWIVSLRGTSLGQEAKVRRSGDWVAVAGHRLDESPTRGLEKNHCVPYKLKFQI